ncbi:MAG: NAD(+)/NADH kinase [Erysipelotrichaceae bacterium]
MKYAIVSKPDEMSNAISIHIRNKLDEANWIESTCPEIVITVGGDGTILFAIQKYFSLLKNIMFVGLKTGTLGFLTDYNENEADMLIEDLLHKQPIIVSKRMVEADIFCENQVKKIWGLNEIRIENNVNTQIMDIYVDDDFLETYRGSGICVATQAGSTAFNRAVNGAIIDENLQLIELSEIIPLRNREYTTLGCSVVLHSNRRIKVVSDDFKNAVLCYDQTNFYLDGCKLIYIYLSDKKVKFASYRNHSYIKRLKTLY